VSSLYSATEANSFQRESHWVCIWCWGFGRNQSKRFPSFGYTCIKGNDDDLTTITFLGCISGFGFGISEAGDYSMRYKMHLIYGEVTVQNYLIDQFTRLITLPFLHAVWTGITGYFIALGTKNRKLLKGLFAGGLLLAATLHGLYDVNSDNVWGLVIAMFSIVIFIAYIRSAEILQKKIKQLAG
jgi:protease PrsW